MPLAAMSLGNEPGYSADYPSMTTTPAQEAKLAELVGPGLHERGVELWAVDHNWADRPRYDEVLAGAPGAFDAAAFHCYAGEPDQMRGLAVPPIVTECTGTRSSWSEAFDVGRAAPCRREHRGRLDRAAHVEPRPRPRGRATRCRLQAPAAPRAAAS